MTLEMTAQEYEQHVLKSLKDNPPFDVGMMVCVYSRYEHKKLLGIGRITKMFWSDFYSQYCLDVEMFDGSFKDALACDCDRISYSGNALRNWMYAMNGIYQ